MGYHAVFFRKFFMYNPLNFQRVLQEVCVQGRNVLLNVQCKPFHMAKGESREVRQRLTVREQIENIIYSSIK